jgi:hypothetical protein
MELIGSPRLAAAWVLWCLALAVGLVAGTSLAMPLRAGLGLLLPVPACLGVRLLLARQPHDIGRLRWQADGRWWLQDRRGRCAYVQPQPPQRLGSLLWFRWQEAGRRRVLIIDGTTVEPNQWRRLKAGLQFARA